MATTTTEIISKNIKESYEILMDSVSNIIAHELMDDNDPNNMKIFPTFLKAYNMWQEDTQDGVDYIFDITDKQDVIDLLKGDFSVGGITSIYNGQEHQAHTRYFRYGQNYELPMAFRTMKELKEYLAKETKWVIIHLFLFRNDTEEYKTIFDIYVGKLFNK